MGTEGACKIITVIDAPCGAGKTEYIIRRLNAQQDRPFLYISPLRKMFERIEGTGEYEGRGVARSVFTPTVEGYNRTKSQSIKEMVGVGVDIMSTHSLFLQLDTEVVDMFRRYDYELIIDEAPDIVSVLSKNDRKDEDDFCFRELKRRVGVGDLETLLVWGCVRIDAGNYNRVIWIKAPSEHDHRYKDVERMIQTGTISYINGSFLVWSFPVSALDAFENIIILTYRFDSSILKAYLDFYGKEYVHKTIIRRGNEFCLEDFSPEIGKGSQYADLINVCRSDKLNAIGVRYRKRYPLSFTWYNNADKIQKKALKDNMINYFRWYCDASCDSVMWTAYKSFSDSIKPRGYIVRRDGTPTFTPCNSRATEEYSDRYNLAYLIDRHIHPGIRSFFYQKGIVIDEDEFALSEFIQWIFRSRVRFGEKINLYVPSERMRELLCGWLSLDGRRRKL